MPQYTRKEEGVYRRREGGGEGENERGKMGEDSIVSRFLNSY